MMSDSKQYILLRKLLKALGLSAARIDELVAIIQSWLADEEEEEPQFPYHLRDDFLSPAELNFYRVLQTAVSDWALICPKVNLGDLFFASTGERRKNWAFRNKINRKHVDFLLCHSETVRPLLGIELDDRSHRRADRRARDTFVNGVFRAAELPLVRVPVNHSYPVAKLRGFLRGKAAVSAPEEDEVAEEPEEETAVPNCPKCGALMVLRTAQRGPNAGNEFWGCPHYPQCRGIRNLSLSQG